MTRSDLEREGFEHVGNIGVDAGLCWVGDPCYIIHKDNSEEPALGKDWLAFCDNLHGNSTSFKYALGHEGLGVVVSTGWGDGFYPVFIRKERGRIAEVRVLFMEDEEN